MAQIFYIKDIILKNMAYREVSIVVTADDITEVIEELVDRSLVPRLDEFEVNKYHSLIGYVEAVNMNHLLQILETGSTREFYKTYPDLPF